MRAWRALKASGAAVLRDGAYLLPQREGCRHSLSAVELDVRSAGGTTYLLTVNDADPSRFLILFDRTKDYSMLLADIQACARALSSETLAATTRRVRRLRRAYQQLAEIDFFPGETKRQVEAALDELETALSRVLSPDEPVARETLIPRLARADYQQRVWATRERPWVDRLASAWLIRRFIDPAARFVWLASPTDCPPEALGFDFDGATFSHVGSKVTFETLLAAFDLEQPGLNRIAGLVHYLDLGGVQPSEASGVECVLAGLRSAIPDDDHLLQAASGVLDGLLAAFEKEEEQR